LAISHHRLLLWINIARFIVINDYFYIIFFNKKAIALKNILIEMEILKSKINGDLNFQNSLVRIVDVVNFDGPLLTLFEHKENKHIYLLDWINRNSEFNRWLLFETKPNVLDKFVKGTISHYDLFMSEDSNGYFVDIDTHLNWSNCQIFQKKNLPSNYLPKKDVFFDEYDCPNFPRLKAFIDLSITAEMNTFKAQSKGKTPKKYAVEESNTVWSVAEPDVINFKKNS
jgi:hypothetical protein